MIQNSVPNYLPPMHQKLAVLVLAFLGVLWIIRMVRHHRIREEHALVWFIGLGGSLVLVWWSPPLILITRLLGVQVPASALLLLSQFFLFAVGVWLTTVVSHQKRQISDLIITTSILHARQRGTVPEKAAEPASSNVPAHPAP